MESFGLVRRVAVLGLVQTFAIGWVLQRLHDHGDADLHVAAGHSGHAGHAGHTATTSHERLNPIVHWLRDASLAAPFVIGVLLLATLAARAVLRRRDVAGDTGRARLAFAVIASLVAAAASAPGVVVHGWLFDADQTHASTAAHLLAVALVTLRFTFAIALAFALAFGLPWRPTTRVPTTARAAGAPPEVVPC